MNKDKIREYIACPEFGDDHYGKWGALRLDQRDCIRRLLEENEMYERIIKAPKGVQTKEKQPLLTIEDIQLYILGLETENKKIWQRYREEHEQICDAIEALKKLSSKIEFCEGVSWHIKEIDEIISKLKGNIDD